MISLVVPIYKERKNIKYMLHKLEQQTNKDFEVIFVVDTFSENTLKEIDDNSQKIKSKIKIIFNSKRIGRTEAEKLGVEKSKGKYILITTTADFFRENFIEELINLTDKYKTDIIEFDARFHKPFWLNGNPRKNIKFSKNAGSKSDVFAYTFPFEFNKLIKRKLLQNVAKDNSINIKTINSIYSVELVLRAILAADSFVSVPKRLIRIKRPLEISYNPIQLNREWLKMINNESFKGFRSSLEYNRYFTNKVIYTAVANAHKNKIMNSKLEKYINNEFDEEFFETNEYMLLNNNEANLLKDYRNKRSIKLYKEF